MAAAVLAVLALSGCAGAGVTERTGSAADEWVRTYSIAAGGEVSIANRNGSIEVGLADGDEVEVRAERSVRAVDDEAASRLLPQVEIEEDISPARVAVRTKGVNGILIGVGFEVQYHVRVPLGVNVRVQTSNGPITVEGVDADVVMTSTNGPIAATGLRGSVESRAVNGPTRIAMASVTDQSIEIRGTNGRVDVVVPGDATATLDASAVNGSVTVAGLDFEPIGNQTPRRTHGRINGGGAPLEIAVVNGRVRVSTEAEADDPQP
jgi:hypothetical protein